VQQRLKRSIAAYQREAVTRSVTSLVQSSDDALGRLVLAAWHSLMQQCRAIAFDRQRLAALHRQQIGKAIGCMLASSAKVLRHGCFELWLALVQQRLKRSIAAYQREAVTRSVTSLVQSSDDALGRLVFAAWHALMQQGKALDLERQRSVALHSQQLGKAAACLLQSSDRVLRHGCFSMWLESVMQGRANASEVQRLGEIHSQQIGKAIACMLQSSERALRHACFELWLELMQQRRKAAFAAYQRENVTRFVGCLAQSSNTAQQHLVFAAWSALVLQGKALDLERERLAALHSKQIGKAVACLLQSSASTLRHGCFEVWHEFVQQARAGAMEAQRFSAFHNQQISKSLACLVQSSDRATRHVCFELWLQHVQQNKARIQARHRRSTLITGVVGSFSEGSAGMILRLHWVAWREVMATVGLHRRFCESSRSSRLLSVRKCSALLSEKGTKQVYFNAWRQEVHHCGLLRDRQTDARARRFGKVSQVVGSMFSSQLAKSASVAFQLWSSVARQEREQRFTRERARARSTIVVEKAFGNLAASSDRGRAAMCLSVWRCSADMHKRESMELRRQEELAKKFQDSSVACAAVLESAEEFRRRLRANQQRSAHRAAFALGASMSRQLFTVMLAAWWTLTEASRRDDLHLSRMTLIFVGQSCGSLLVAAFTAWWTLVDASRRNDLHLNRMTFVLVGRVFGQVLAAVFAGWARSCSHSSRDGIADILAHRGHLCRRLTSLFNSWHRVSSQSARSSRENALVGDVRASARRQCKDRAQLLLARIAPESSLVFLQRAFASWVHMVNQDLCERRVGKQIRCVAWQVAETVLSRHGSHARHTTLYVFVRWQYLTRLRHASRVCRYACNARLAVRSWMWAGRLVQAAMDAWRAQVQQQRVQVRNTELEQATRMLKQEREAHRLQMDISLVHSVFVSWSRVAAVSRALFAPRPLTPGWERSLLVPVGTQELRPVQAWTVVTPSSASRATPRSYEQDGLRPMWARFGEVSAARMQRAHLEAWRRLVQVGVTPPMSPSLLVTASPSEPIARSRPSSPRRMPPEVERMVSLRQSLSRSSSLSGSICPQAGAPDRSGPPPASSPRLSVGATGHRVGAPLFQFAAPLSPAPHTSGCSPCFGPSRGSSLNIPVQRIAPAAVASPVAACRSQSAPRVAAAAGEPRVVGRVLPMSAPQAVGPPEGPAVGRWDGLRPPPPPPPPQRLPPPSASRSPRAASPSPLASSGCSSPRGGVEPLAVAARNVRTPPRGAVRGTEDELSRSAPTLLRHPITAASAATAMLEGVQTCCFPICGAAGAEQPRRWVG